MVCPQESDDRLGRSSRDHQNTDGDPRAASYEVRLEVDEDPGQTEQVSDLLSSK